MHKILYDVKKTRVNTEYLQLSTDDQAIITHNILGILMYMNELSVSSNKQVRDFIKWFNQSNKKYHYNKKLKRNNSPNALLSGTMNNIMFGYQYNFTLLQLEVIQEIINFSIDIIHAIESELDISLQQKPLFTKIFIQENLWVTH